MNLQDFLDNAYLEIKVTNGKNQRIPVSPAQIFSSISLMDGDETITKVKSNGSEFIPDVNKPKCSICEDDFHVYTYNECLHNICEKCSYDHQTIKKCPRCFMDKWKNKYNNLN